ncbi:MAG TPA: hypothetical protein VFV72_13340 [Candidatus Limnocylindrales bacterium]|nr:hypothetical protein [Candidatus Limnocylindrales bacterium]
MAADQPDRLLRRAGLAIAVVVIGAVLLSLVLWLASGPRQMPVAFGRSPIGVVGLVLSPICYAVLGGTLTAYVPHNPIGWIFLAVAVAIGVILPVNLVVASVHEPLRPPPDFVVWVAWARNSFAAPAMVPLLIVGALLFPDGHAPGPRWGVVVAAAIGGGAMLILAAALDPRGLWSYPTLPNPVSLPFALEPAVQVARILAATTLMACGALAVAALLVRYRRGDAQTRAQLRWIVVGGAVSGMLAIPYVLARYVIEVDDGAGELVAALAQVGSCALPLAATFAISRYHLYDVDAVIGRTLVYLPLMGILSGLYTASVALFQRVFVALTGETSDLAVVMTILLVASAFTPIRKVLESAVDRRFPARPPGVEAQPAVAIAAGSVPSVRVLPVDDGATVPCPLGARTLVECLACPHLTATVPGPPPAVICDLRPAEG